MERAQNNISFNIFPRKYFLIYSLEYQLSRYPFNIKLPSAQKSFRDLTVKLEKCGIRVNIRLQSLERRVKDETRCIVLVPYLHTVRVHVLQFEAANTSKGRERERERTDIIERTLYVHKSDKRQAYYSIIDAKKRGRKEGSTRVHANFYRSLYKIQYLKYNGQINVEKLHSGFILSIFLFKKN
ncbi:hypothetical protein PUN28_019991 [Cardiocondyla obscurior]|uniref:Ribosomal protein S10 n=1 Tax=Cardiocondyla obscurior TaxID=286306 RepID=A0AAW2EE69_9HYME